MSDAGLRAASTEHFNIGHVLTETFRIFFRHFIPIAAITILSFAAIGALAAAIAVAMKRAGWDWVVLASPEGDYNVGAIALLAIGTLAFWILAYGVATAGVVVGVFDILNGRGVRFGKMIQISATSAPRVFVTQLVALVFTMIGAALLIVPGVIVGLMLYVIIPVVAVEGRAMSALGRSTDLTRDNLFALFGLGVVLFILSLIFSFVLNIVQATALNASTFGSLAWEISMYAFQGVYYVVATAFPAVATAVAYFELRRVKEGVDTEQLADVFA